MFLFATKNSLLSLLLGPGNGYEKLNYIHRWSGRGLFLCATIHGSLWIRNHIQYNLPILGPQKETSGVAAFALLCIIVLSSLRPVRLYFRQIFFYIQYVPSCTSIWRCAEITGGQRTDLCFVLRHHMLSYFVCAAMDLSCTGVLWSGFAHAATPLSHQGRLVGAYE